MCGIDEGEKVCGQCSQRPGVGTESLQSDLPDIMGFSMLNASFCHLQFWPGLSHLMKLVVAADGCNTLEIKDCAMLCSAGVHMVRALALAGTHGLSGMLFPFFLFSVPFSICSIFFSDDGLLMEIQRGDHVLCRLIVF
ncbi:hypothetical protein Ancab_033636 [Ancistrocladus abbreviatus]